VKTIAEISPVATSTDLAEELLVVKKLSAILKIQPELTGNLTTAGRRP
jgi:hypothetical protein